MSPDRTNPISTVVSKNNMKISTKYRGNVLEKNILSENKCSLMGGLTCNPKRRVPRGFMF